MRIVWISDIHLDHLGRYFINSRKPEITKLVDQIKGLGPDIVMCTGDLTNANLLVEDIEQLISDLDPVKFLFVLGNHDCWGSGWAEIQQLMSTNFPNNWLSSLGSVKLTEEICLVGQDGWYDGLLGKPFVSNIEMNDWHNITDFSSCKDKEGEIDVGLVLDLIKSKAEEETAKLKQVIEKNISSYTTFMIATHIPPFAENALDYPYGKKKPSTKPEKSSVYSLPWYTNKTMGDMLTNLAEQYPDKMFNVFCGHAHADCTVRHRDNLICSTAYSVYGKPEKSIKVIELAT
jgi:predicted MPP superfamily phosphohydrolase